jgi:hypothetical protein
MRTWLVKHPSYKPGKYKGTFTKKGITYYKVHWDRFTVNPKHSARTNKTPFERDLKASECKLYKTPFKIVKKIKDWLHSKKRNYIIVK